MKNKLIVFLLVAACLFCTGCSDDEGNTYQKGIKALESGEYETALNCFENSDVNDADVRQIYRAKGMALLSMGEYDRAKDSFIRALNESNGIIEEFDIDTSYYLAIALYKAGDYKGAENTLDSILSLENDNIMAYYLRGKIKLKLGRVDAAIKDYDKAIEENPRDYDMYIRIYEDLQGEGAVKESEKYIEKAMSLGDKLTDYQKGILEYYQGSYTEARNHLENARESKSDVKLLTYLGKTYEALGDYVYAAGIYQEALSENPSSGILYNQLAEVKIRQADYQGALETIETAFQSSDGEAVQSLMYNRVVVYEKLYDFKSACKYMGEYLEKYPDDEKARREYLFLSTR